MTAPEIRAWRARLGLSQRKAAEAIGISERMYIYYEAGQREDGRRVEIPKTVALACAAVAYGLPPMGE
jgi:transcriptional regulator with XRE-family HTH domain